MVRDCISDCGQYVLYPAVNGRPAPDFKQYGPNAHMVKGKHWVEADFDSVLPLTEENLQYYIEIPLWRFWLNGSSSEFIASNEYIMYIRFSYVPARELGWAFKKFIDALTFKKLVMSGSLIGYDSPPGSEAVGGKRKHRITARTAEPAIVKKKKKETARPPPDPTVLTSSFGSMLPLRPAQIVLQPVASNDVSGSAGTGSEADNNLQGGSTHNSDTSNMQSTSNDQSNGSGSKNVGATTIVAGTDGCDASGITDMPTAPGIVISDKPITPAVVNSANQIAPTSPGDEGGAVSAPAVLHGSNGVVANKDPRKAVSSSD